MLVSSCGRICVVGTCIHSVVLVRDRENFLVAVDFHESLHRFKMFELNVTAVEFFYEWAFDIFSLRVSFLMIKKNTST